MSEHDEDGYAGEAVLVIDGTEIAVQVELRGYFQPIDGYYRWYGRVATNEQVSAAVDGKKTAAEFRAGEYTAKGELSDPDPWDRYRIMGTSTPPFPVPTTLEEPNT